MWNESETQVALGLKRGTYSLRQRSMIHQVKAEEVGRAPPVARYIYFYLKKIKKSKTSRRATEKFKLTRSSWQRLRFTLIPPHRSRTLPRVDNSRKCAATVLPGSTDQTTGTHSRPTAQ